jgi:hypothetical protein
MSKYRKSKYETDSESDSSDSSYYSDKGRNDLFLQRSKTNEEDLNDLRNGVVNGVMRGSDVASALLLRNPDLDIMPSWDSVQGLLPNFGPQLKSREVFSFPCSPFLVTFINMRITQLLLNGELEELTKLWIDHYDIDHVHQHCSSFRAEDGEISSTQAKALLKRYKLSRKGTKEELCKRLQEHGITD